MRENRPDLDRLNHNKTTSHGGATVIDSGQKLTQQYIIFNCFVNNENRAVYGLR